METWNPQARTGWVESVGKPGSGRAALQGSVKPQSLGDTWHSKKQREAISWPVLSCQCDDTRKHWDAKWITLRWTKCSWKLCTTAQQRKTPRGPYITWSCHARVMTCRDAETARWTTAACDAAQCLTREEAKRGCITSDVVMPTWWDAEMLKWSRVTREKLIPQLDIWQRKKRDVPSWMAFPCQCDEMLDAEMLRWTIPALKTAVPRLNCWPEMEQTEVLSQMVPRHHDEMLRC